MIKYNIKAVLLVVFASLVAFAGVVSANDLDFSANTTVTINSNSYTVSGGSSATSMVVGATTLTVTVPASGTFTLVSSDRYLLNNDQGVVQHCTDAQNSIIISGPLTVIVTPTASACTVPVAGGGSPPASYTPPATDTTPPTNTSISIAGGAASTASASVILTLGATDATQMTISNDSAFTGAAWETYTTSKTWTLTSGSGTKTVYAKFRDAAGNASAAVSDTITSTAATTTEQPATTTQTLGPITISKPLTSMTRDELVSTLLKLVLTLIVQGKLTHL
jgi:hypothetical protein